ncbi:hypothetical protein KAW18_03950 [candidate division WOR-3 bacterium]|nr:hypothetical protein [candidate division WOR-3 bacterium]
MNTIQSTAVNNNSPISVKRVNVEKLVYNPSHVKNNCIISEQCIITTQQETFSAWGVTAEVCIIHLIKGESLCCTYISKNGKLDVVQINGCNSTRVSK